MSGPTRLNVPYVSVHSPNLAAALFTVGIPFVDEFPSKGVAISRQNGKPLRERELTFFLSPKSLDGSIGTNHLIQAWKDAETPEKEGDTDNDIIKAYEKTLADIETESNEAARKRLTKKLGLYLSHLVVYQIRLFLRNAKEMHGIAKAVPQYERKHKPEARVRKLKELEARKREIEKEITKLRSSLSARAPRQRFPRLVPSEQDRSS